MALNFSFCVTAVLLAFDSLSLPKAGRVSAGRELSRIVINIACTNVFAQLDGYFPQFRKWFESPEEAVGMPLFRVVS
jgi:hypothetical protein